MHPANQTDNEQEKLWNGPTAHAWVDMQELLDQMLKPFQDMLVEAVSLGPGGRVLDVGCGTGATTVAVARRLAEKGRATGIDISDPMLAAARARAEREGTAASFILANAQTYPFEPASFDMIISRFGVMFFDDPVQAFTNLQRAAADNAVLRFIAWRSPEENPFMTAAERAAAPLLPDVPPRAPDAPGPFALADKSRLHNILEESGWATIDVQPIDATCTLPAKDLTPLAIRLGPLGRVLQEVDDATRARIIEAVRPAFEPFVHGAEIRFTAACWMAGARSLKL